MDDQHFPSANLIDFPDDDFADEVGIPLVDILLFDVPDTLAERLPGGHHGAPAEILHVKFLAHFVSDLKVRVDLDGVFPFDLRDRIFKIQVGDNFPDVKDLDVAMIGVQDDLKGLIRSVAFLDHGTKDILHDQLKQIALDALLAGNFRKGRNKV